MDKPTFDELLAGAKIAVANGRGAVNCTYVMAAEGRPYPRTCQRCRLGPCPFTDFLLAERKPQATDSKEADRG